MNVGELSEWVYYEDFTFYAIVGLAAWLVITIPVLTFWKKLANLSVFEKIKNRNSESISFLTILWSNYLVNSAFLGIYCHKDKNAPKARRAITFFTRFLHLMIFVSYLGPTSDEG